jgi:hypothetical protein
MTTMATPSTTRPPGRRALALLLPLVLAATSCINGESDGEAVVDVQTSQEKGAAVGVATDEPGSADTDSAGDDPADGGGDDAGGAGSAEGTGAVTDQPADTDRPNAQMAAAATIDDLLLITDPVGEVDETALVLDQPNEGEIESGFGIDRWSFEGQDGLVIAVDILDIGNDCRQDLNLNLVTPSGDRYSFAWVGNGGCHAHGPIVLTETGTWALEFAGGDGAVISETTGAYRFVPTVVTEVDTNPIVFDQPNEGEISQLFGVDQWTFEASAGQTLTIDVHQIDDDCDQDLELALVDPFGERVELGWIGNGGCTLQGPFELERDGTYALEFAGGDGGVIEDSTGPYRFTPTLLE